MQDYSKQRSIYEDMLDKLDELLPEEIEMEYIDYNDSLNTNCALIQECIDEHSTYPLDEEFWEWYRDQRHAKTEEIKQEYIPMLKQYYLDALVEELSKKYDQEIEDIIYEHASDEPIHELLENSHIRARIEMLDNEEGISNYGMEFSSYKYLHRVCNILNANPRTLYHKLTEKYDCVLDSLQFENHPERDGNEAVDMDELAELFADINSYTLNLTFIGLLPLAEMYDHNFQDEDIIIEPNTLTIFFQHLNGTGTCVDVKTKKTIHISLKDTGYDRFQLYVDMDNSQGGCGYSTDKTYGWAYRFDTLFHYKNNEA